MFEFLEHLPYSSAAATTKKNFMEIQIWMLIPGIQHKIPYTQQFPDKG